MQIKVKVYAPGFVNHENIDERGYILLEEGASLNDLYNKIKLPLPLRLNFFCSVNYDHARWNTKLKEGDVVSFLFPLTGG